MTQPRELIFKICQPAPKQAVGKLSIFSDDSACRKKFLLNINFINFHLSYYFTY
jgi:hypothetical protein